MDVGVNYPWYDYGWDFGLGPPAWRGARTDPRWYDKFDGHLRYFQNLGIRVVRWFILADGLTYGTGADAPRRDTVTGQWVFDPPPAPPEFLQHFEEMLVRFETANGAGAPIQLLPVLIDFHFCQPVSPDSQSAISDSGWVKQGRADAINDAMKRTQFLDQVFEPLLAASRNHSRVIYAWELINEPEWITNGWHPGGASDLPVDEASMRDFLEDGKARIRSSGLKPTIGFATIDTLRLTGITTEINQFHHYPGGNKTLERSVFNPQYPGIVGEFATATSDFWPDLEGNGQSVLSRLRLTQAQGYPLALPWSFLAVDDHTSWTPATEHDIECFTQGSNCPGE